jgi:enamine deaminase RidA (YjgF/YER057c/UK114 family)
MRTNYPYSQIYGAIDCLALRILHAPPIYSQVVKVTGAQTILYIAGQVAYDEKGNPAHVGDFKAQARAVLTALKTQVEAGGGTMQNIVKANTYLTDIRHRADYAPIREEFFGKKMPAHTLVAVAALAMPEYLIEVEGVAVL